MRFAVLTTDTSHHRYFLRRLAAELPDGAEIVLNIIETKGYPWRRKARRHILESLPNLWKAFALNPYRQSATLAQRQATFEEKHFFPDDDDALPEGFPTHAVHSANEDDCLAFIQAAAPDALLVYGTGKLLPRVFNIAPMGAINAHGGLIPGYRGLDTNLWAALEGRPGDMAVTLHAIDADLDTGPVYETRFLPPAADLNLSSLRYHTAVLCTDMFLDLIRGLVAGEATATPQRGESQYFGPMPTRLKLRAEEIILAWIVP